MLLENGFELVLASPDDRNDLVAEIYFEGKFFGLVGQIRPGGDFYLESPGPHLIETQLVRKVPLEGFLQVVQAATRRLSGPSDGNP